MSNIVVPSLRGCPAPGGAVVRSLIEVVDPGVRASTCTVLSVHANRVLLRQAVPVAISAMWMPPAIASAVVPAAVLNFVSSISREVAHLKPATPIGKLQLKGCDGTHEPNEKESSKTAKGQELCRNLAQATAIKRASGKNPSSSKTTFYNKRANGTNPSSSTKENFNKRANGKNLFCSSKLAQRRQMCITTTDLSSKSAWRPATVNAAYLPIFKEPASAPREDEIISTPTRLSFVLCCQF